MNLEKAQKVYKSIFVISCIIFLGCYISLIFNENVWTDEAYTIRLIRKNTLTQIIAATADDVHPPLYYLMLKVFISIFGDSMITYKLFSIVPLILCYILAGTRIKRYWGNNTAILFIFFINAIPSLLEYVVQIRMYSWAMFWVTWAAVSAFGVYKERRISDHIQLIIAALGACYTHNYAMLSCVCIYAFLAIFMIKSPRQWSISGIVVALFYSPWLFILYQQTTNRIGNYWIEPVTVRTVISYVEYLFGSDIPYSPWMLGILCLMTLIQCLKSINMDRVKALSAICMFTVPVVIALIGIIVSIVVTPFFIARYLVQH